MFFSGYAQLWNLVSQYLAPTLCESLGPSGTDLVTGLCCIMAYDLLKMLCLLPFSYYEIFRIDQQFGMSEANCLSFLIEKIMVFIQNNVLVLPIFALFYKVLETFGDDQQLLLFAGLTAVVELCILWIYPVLLAPLTSKLTPMDPNSQTKKDIDALCVKLDYK